MAIRFIAAIALVCGLVGTASAQKTTEMYIPIGQSPGLAGKTSIGTIASVNAQSEQLVLIEGTVQRTIRCDARTQIWMDRSAKQQPNGKAAFADCRAAQRIEVKFVNNAKDGGLAEWIKVAEP